ncbi:MAG: Gfo/Idh/MocA family oxidoreductase [Gammaproteobacteria bacterium]|nr:Gfo/Idh/MocA family oxidoreductase [Gammaproteobacteria bacterium]MYF31258.1 Gfo/Idh/MocA family oxidoreductase [Gammaproteobacteria bacterium]MYK48430.1 Gfo/Idh/MocA family oxidoreductase [Gammaproteobacteria bacterium]
MTQSDRLTLAFVGCGGIARAHWRGIQHYAPRIDVTAVVDTDPANLASMAERTGAAAFTSLTEALAEGDFDAVDIMLPHDLHEQAAVESFAAGKHVCLEKPMAHNLASCERILAAAEAAAEQSGTVFMIAEQAQYWTDVQKARELIDAGAIGDVITARACFYDPLTVPPGVIPWRYELARAGGGISIDGGAHWIRPMRMMLGEVDEVIAATARHVADMEGESSAHALFRFESGVVGTFDALQSTGAVGPVEDFRITGTNGELVMERGRNGRLMLYNGEHPDGLAVMSAFEGKAASYGVELHDFSCAVLDGKELEASPAFSLGELRTALAMYRSVESGRWEKVWD